MTRQEAMAAWSRLRAEREALDMTTESLARLAGVSVDALRRAEAGRRPAREALEAVRRALEELAR